MNLTSDHETGWETLESYALNRASMRLSGSLLEFAKGAWPIVEPKQKFQINWHVVELCKILEDLTYTKEIADALLGERGAPIVKRAFEEMDRAIINVPPGTMKSLLVSVFWPCWLWARNAEYRILTATYSDKRALDANLKARNIIKSDWYQLHFPKVQLKEDQDAKGRFDTTQGGWRIATSVGGEGTGLHPDFFIIDDASTAQDAQSEAARKAVNDWFSNTVSTRGVTRNVVIVIIGQRLHQEDLSGYLMASAGRASWTRVVWPMRYEKCTCPAPSQTLTEQQRCVLHKADPDWQPDSRDPRTEPGELLWPSLYPEEKVRQLELDLGNDAAGQLQQRPSPEGGTLFKREWFKFLAVLPTTGVTVKWARGWDTAGTEGAGDYTATCKVGTEYSSRMENGYPVIEKTGRIFIADPYHAQLGPDGVDQLIERTARADGLEVMQREEKEGGSAGLTVVQARAKRLVGLDYKGVPVSGSKATRAKPFRSQCEAGNVFLIGEGWEDYLRELCNFPNGKHDDYVDCTSCAFNAVLLEEPPESVECTW